ncbi:MAG: hypothetical protein ACRELB_03065 [Polyangiaceae bacterium]
MPRRFLAVLPLLVACGGGARAAATGQCGPCGSSGVALPRPARVEQLARQRVELARKRLVQMRAAFEHGSATLDELFAALRDVAFAARDSGLHGETLRSILTEYRDAVLALQGLTRERMQKGAVGPEALSRVESLLAEAEYWLAEATPQL